MSRLDKFLWSVRIYKTRSEAAESCKSGKVKVNDIQAKPSKEIKPRDIIEVRKRNIFYKYQVIEQIEKRQPAKLIDNYIKDITPEEELAKLNLPKEAIFIQRDRGSGRPTKKERRDLDNLLNF